MYQLKPKWEYFIVFVNEFPEYQEIYEQMRSSEQSGDILTALQYAGDLHDAMRAKGRR
ncbi:hypothetical protein MHH60_31935 [Paenibacillus sp. FSL H7-0716]|uniref:hypothetical protein n=1 Tax=Paenibacillus TaxID=44249 RepID=UPI0015C3FE16|nr:hypothetical protein [Paenibacillus odorifer]